MTRVFKKELPSFAEPVTESDLVIDNAFFTISFIDDNGKDVPVVETLLLKKIENIDDEKVYFFYELGFWDLHLNIDIKPENRFYKFTINQMSTLFTFDKAMNVLLNYSLEKR